jgi:hypothetical protein
MAEVPRMQARAVIGALAALAAPIAPAFAQQHDADELAAGGQSMSYLVGARYYADGPVTTPQWGLRAALTFLFPKG